MNRALALWRRLERWPLGKLAFSRAISWKAPYFASISPRFEELRPGYARVSMRKRRAVANHIGTVHAIAMCNLAEVEIRDDAGELVCRATITMWVAPRKR